MSTDYIVASLPTLAFNAPAPLSWEKFVQGGGDVPSPQAKAWADLETQLRNAVAEARGISPMAKAMSPKAMLQQGCERFRRPAEGCSLYWRNRVLACFQERDVAKRDELLDRVWWDAAGELTPPSEPLGKGALATYAIRLKIALKRTLISKDAGNASFDRLTAETRNPQPATRNSQL